MMRSSLRFFLVFLLFNLVGYIAEAKLLRSACSQILDEFANVLHDPYFDQRYGQVSQYDGYRNRDRGKTLCGVACIARVQKKIYELAPPVRAYPKEGNAIKYLTEVIAKNAAGIDPKLLSNGKKGLPILALEKMIMASTQIPVITKIISPYYEASLEHFPQSISIEDFYLSVRDNAAVIAKIGVYTEKGGVINWLDEAHNHYLIVSGFDRIHQQRIIFDDPSGESRRFIGDIHSIDMTNTPIGSRLILPFPNLTTFFITPVSTNWSQKFVNYRLLIQSLLIVRFRPS